MRLLYVGGVVAIVGTFLYDVWFDMDYEFDANISITYLAVLVTVFTFLYGFRSKWRANTVGKVVMVKSIFLSLVLWQIVVSAWLGTDYPYRPQIRFALYTAGAWTYGAMVWSLWRQQQTDRGIRKSLRELEDSVDDDRS